MNQTDQTRRELGTRLVVYATIALSVLAFIVVFGGGISEYGGWKGAFKDTVQLLFSSLLPLFGTWVGTVLAFYFSKENFEAASRGTLDVVRSVTARLAETKVVDAMMPRGRMITLVLQLRFIATFVMGACGVGLVLSSPDRPIHDKGDAEERRKLQARDQCADFRHAWNERRK